MEKRGVKKSFVILSLSIILILSISLVSASFFSDFFKRFITGQATQGGDNCVDSDGKWNYNEAGTVTTGIDFGSVVYYDYCEGSIAYDYYCDVTGGGMPVASFLPLTGNVIGEPTLPAKRGSMDCAAAGKICWSGGICGCSALEKNVVCGPTEAGIGICRSGTTYCMNGGQYAPCNGAVYPAAEVCNGLDDDCNYYVDEYATCPSGQTCTGGQCVVNACSPATCTIGQCGTHNNGTCGGTLNCGSCPSGQTCNSNGTCVVQTTVSCTDQDGDRYSTEANPLMDCENKCGNSTTGSLTCLGGNDCNDANSNVNPGKTDTTCDGIDNNCASGIDEQGTTWCKNQHSGANYTCVSGSCIPPNCQAISQTEACSGKQCGNVSDGCTGTYSCGVCASGSCTNNQCQAPACTDADGDKYVKESQTSGCSVSGIIGFKGYDDCNDDLVGGSDINPGKTETCTDGLDNNCDNKADCADPVACPATLPACKTCTSDPNYCANNNILCGTTTDNCGNQITCENTCPIGESCSSNKCIQCTFGQSRECGANIGECKKGIETCVDGRWSGNCIGGAISTNETCDNKDNNCNNETDDGLVGEYIPCISEDYGCIEVLQDCFQGVQFNTCESMTFKSVSTKEVCGDDVDDNCDGSLVDSCTGCTDGDTSTCHTGNLCETAKQTCTNNQWGTCEVISTDPNCNQDTICTPLEMEICGQNGPAANSICTKGSRTCKADGTWGECNDVKPVTEICDDQLDNDCDGQTDEGCDSGNQTGCQSDAECPQDYECKNSLCSPVNAGNGNNGGIEEESTSFWKRLINFFVAIFRVGQVLLGGSITPSSTTPTQVFCADSDNGKAIFVKGTGEGLSQQDVKTLFSDTCFEDNLNNQVESCMGDNCYLAEYFCSDKHVKYEKDTCEFGCSSGACIPTKADSQECQSYFDEETFELVNPCE